jgi:putative selenate reductase FAD-binding subunit
MEDRRYYVPNDPDEALVMKAAGGETARYLAGGTLVNWGPVKDETSTLIDLRNVCGNKIRRGSTGFIVEAGVPLQQLADAEELPDIINRGADFVAARQIRNMATIGGNIAAMRNDSNLIPALLVLNADLRLYKAGKISVMNYTIAPEIYENDIILEVIIPESKGPGVMKKVTRSNNGYPVLIAAVTLKPEPIIVVNGALPAIIRLGRIEEALTADPELPKERIEKIVAEEIPVIADIHGSVEYKKYIAGVTVADLVAECRADDSAKGGRK